MAYLSLFSLKRFSWISWLLNEGLLLRQKILPVEKVSTHLSVTHVHRPLTPHIFLYWEDGSFLSDAESASRREVPSREGQYLTPSQAVTSWWFLFLNDQPCLDGTQEMPSLSWVREPGTQWGCLCRLMHAMAADTLGLTGWTKKSSHDKDILKPHKLRDNWRNGKQEVAKVCEHF